MFFFEILPKFRWPQPAWGIKFSDKLKTKVRWPQLITPLPRPTSFAYLCKLPSSLPASGALQSTGRCHIRRGHDGRQGMTVKRSFLCQVLMWRRECTASLWFESLESAKERGHIEWLRPHARGIPFWQMQSLIRKLQDSCGCCQSLSFTCPACLLARKCAKPEIFRNCLSLDGPGMMVRALYTALPAENIL